jgi:hypothetical protein
MRDLRIDELKALLAVTVAGVFALLSVLAIELYSIRLSLERIEQELRPPATSGGRVGPQRLLYLPDAVAPSLKLADASSPRAYRASALTVQSLNGPELPTSNRSYPPACDRDAAGELIRSRKTPRYCGAERTSLCGECRKSRPLGGHQAGAALASAT